MIVIKGPIWHYLEKLKILRKIGQARTLKKSSLTSKLVDQLIYVLSHELQVVFKHCRVLMLGSLEKQQFLLNFRANLALFGVLLRNTATSIS